MAGVKISALQAVPSAQTTDVYPVVQGGITKKESVSQLTTLLNTTIQLSSTSQITGLSGLLANYLPLAGGIMTGSLILNTNSPSTALEAASKGYVDTVASGFTVILACLGATTANLNTTYANGASGVGATLTDAAGTFLPFSVDGLSPAVGSRILVKNQTTTYENGVYELTQNGDSVSVPYILTRATDYDTPAQIQPGTLVAVNSGTVNGTTSWLETATVTTIGTDPILFSQFTFAPTQFLLVANNLSDVASVSTSRTNLGLGTAATKAASASGEAVLASVTGSFTPGNIAVFSDSAGTIEDSGSTPSGLSYVFLCNGRLTLTSGLPVTTTNVTAATTVYFTPYGGNQIALYNGSNWQTLTFTELSIAVPATTNIVYDLFVYNNSGTPTLETTAWSNDTTRATALVRQDGVYVKSGATTRRYVGTFRTTSTSGQTEDSLSKRYVWNYYNRVLRPMNVVDTTNSWVYSTAAFRQANANTANQLDYVQGVAEDALDASVFSAVTSATVSANNILVGIGIDSTTVNSAITFGGTAVVASVYSFPQASYNGLIAAGRHTLVWLEYGAGSGTQTWYGDAGTTTVQSGIKGNLLG